MEANQTPDPTGYTTMAALDAEPPRRGSASPRCATGRSAKPSPASSWAPGTSGSFTGLSAGTTPHAAQSCSLLWRARQAGEAAAIGSVREHLASRADHIGRRLADEHAERQAIAEETAAHLRMLAHDAKPPPADSEP